MEFRTLEIKIMSAKDLNKVTVFSRMNVYVVVSISGGNDKSKQVSKTPVDRDGGANPAWNFPVKFTVDEAAARQGRLMLVFKLRCQRVLGDRDVGEVIVPVKELLDSPAASATKQFVNYQVKKPSGKPKGQLTFCYQFGEKTNGPPPIAAVAANKVDEPVTAYPAFTPAYPGSSSSVYSPGPTPPPRNGPAASGAAYPPPVGYPPAGYGYPPPPAAAAYGSGYPHPPPPAYGYPPQPGYGYPSQSGYGYPPVQPPKKNKFGLGLGAGLLGGALGGMLIGDAISDAAAYDAGYDDGFDGGFDF
ncbi:PREDICTED: protein SRC2-like [Ipomoea nil]|uniref:protein SRC2-like n=1 Tax=Ipomoea nil TaxID=35883 RepID=UPI000901224E|nr:PREDICTED: protein SRC2-like [Ipomoea nil]